MYLKQQYCDITSAGKRVQSQGKAETKQLINKQYAKLLVLTLTCRVRISPEEERNKWIGIRPENTL